MHRDSADVLSDYNPVLAADGARSAFETVDGGRTVIVVRDLASGRDRVAARGAPMGRDRFADVYDPGLSADGSRLVFTLASGTVREPHTATSDVCVVDLRTDRTTVVAASHGGFAVAGTLSPDGRWVAFV